MEKQIAGNVSNPLISVVTVVYNDVDAIEPTILSVLGQTYPQVEYIVMDGGSTDGTVEKVQQYRDKISYFRSGRDKGIYDAMNKSLMHVHGEWVIFMNAGDCFASDQVVGEIFSAAARYAAHAVIYGDAVIQYNGYATVFQRAPVSDIWKSTPFIHQAAFIRTSVMVTLGYDTRFKIGADHDFFYRAFHAGESFHYCGRTVCIFDGTEGTTRENILLAIREKRDIALKFRNRMGTRLYYAVFLAYVRLSRFAQTILGQRFTGYLKRKRKNRNWR